MLLLLRQAASAGISSRIFDICSACIPPPPENVASAPFIGHTPHKGRSGSLFAAARRGPWAPAAPWASYRARLEAPYLRAHRPEGPRGEQACEPRHHSASSGRIGLLAVSAGRLARFRIDEMDQSTHEAGDAHKDIIGSFGLIVVWSPALHPVT
jgi:hypothetical protein